jgi:hypothetical protein
MKKLVMIVLTTGLVFANSIKNYGEIKSDGGIFSSNYNMKIICVDHIKYLLIERTGARKGYGFMSPKYKLVSGKPVIETCK